MCRRGVPFPATSPVLTRPPGRRGRQLAEPLLGGAWHGRTKQCASVTCDLYKNFHRLPRYSIPLPAVGFSLVSTPRSISHLRSSAPKVSGTDTLDLPGEQEKLHTSAQRYGIVLFVAATDTPVTIARYGIVIVGLISNKS